MDNTLDLLQHACCDRMDVFDRARIEEALVGPRYPLPSGLRDAEDIRAFILSKANDSRDAVEKSSLWNGEENV